MNSMVLCQDAPVLHVTQLLTAGADPGGGALGAEAPPLHI